MHIVIIGKFPPSAQAKIRQSFPPQWRISIAPPNAAEPFLADADVVIPEHIPVNAAFLDKAPQLKLVQTGAGYDNVDIAACTARRVRVCNAAGVNAAAVAEHVMALILCWYKNIALLDSSMKANQPMPDYTGAELSGKTIGIVGLGHTGQRVAAYCSAFGMEVLGYSRTPKDLPGVRSVDLETLYRESDIVSLHLPLSPETQHLIGAEAFSKMKSSALLVNTARGAIINEAQLVEALEHHVIGGACLDVFEQEPLPLGHPLRALPNVLLTPHTAGLPDGVKYHQKRYAFFLSNILKVMNGQQPDCALNQV